MQSRRVDSWRSRLLVVVGPVALGLLLAGAIAAAPDPKPLKVGGLPVT